MDTVHGWGKRSERRGRHDRRHIGRNRGQGRARPRRANDGQSARGSDHRWQYARQPARNGLLTAFCPIPIRNADVRMEEADRLLELQ